MCKPPPTSTNTRPGNRKLKMHRTKIFIQAKTLQLCNDTYNQVLVCVIIYHHTQVTGQLLSGSGSTDRELISVTVSCTENVLQSMRNTPAHWQKAGLFNSCLSTNWVTFSLPLSVTSDIRARNHILSQRSWIF